MASVPELCGIFLAHGLTMWMVSIWVFKAHESWGNLAVWRRESVTWITVCFLGCFVCECFQMRYKVWFFRSFFCLSSSKPKRPKLQNVNCASVSTCGCLNLYFNRNPALNKEWLFHLLCLGMSREMSSTAFHCSPLENAHVPFWLNEPALTAVHSPACTWV